MARGVRKSIEEKIADKQEVIDALEIRILKEKEELQILVNEQRMARLESLEELIDSSNLSLEEVSEILRQHVDEEAVEV
jgi:hypothetical protein